jgi:hypothetical protein
LDIRGSVQIWHDGNVSVSNRPNTTSNGTRGFGVGVDTLVLRTTNHSSNNAYSSSILFTAGIQNYPFGRISGIDSLNSGGTWMGHLVFEAMCNTLLTEKMRITEGGVGINTSTNRTYPLVVEGFAGYQSDGAYFNSVSVAGGLSNYNCNTNTSIFSRADVIAGAFRAYSDERIKTNIQDVQDDDALQRLRLIQPKTYTYKDVVTKGTEPVYGFIAQQVREVLPYSTGIIKNYIPDIYKVGDRVDDLVTLRDSTFSFSESSGNVRFINKKGSDFIVPVNFISSNQLQILDTTKVDSSEPEIFVYGREVDDFHSLNKDAIFTVNVAATQEIDRQLQAAKVQIASLETRLTTLESQFASQTQQ